MPKYTHYYVCQCKKNAKPSEPKYVIEESESDEPNYNGFKHQKLQYDERQKERQKSQGSPGDDIVKTCWETLHWHHTEEIEGTSSKIIKETGVAKVEPEKKGVPRTAEKPIMDVAVGKDLVQKRAGNVDKEKTSTVAVMWEPVTGTWYQGSSGHPLPKAGTKIPDRIKKYIQGLQVDNADWAFGWNCAEVQCIATAYKKGKTDPGGDAPLRGCYFIAASAGNAKRPYGPCKTCRDWIKRFGGSFFMPQD